MSNRLHVVLEVFVQPDLTVQCLVWRDQKTLIDGYSSIHVFGDENMRITVVSYNGQKIDVTIARFFANQFRQGKTTRIELN